MTEPRTHTVRPGDRVIVLDKDGQTWDHNVWIVLALYEKFAQVRLYQSEGRLCEKSKTKKAPRHLVRWMAGPLMEAKP